MKKLFLKVYIKGKGHALINLDHIECISKEIEIYKIYVANDQGTYQAEKIDIVEIGCDDISRSMLNY